MALKVDITKKLKGFKLNVAFEAGHETMALLGPSGCGKSMTLKCIAGVVRPDEGHIELDGVTLFDSAARIDLKPQQRHVGMLFQHYALFPHMTVYQNVACGARGVLRGTALNQAVNDALTSFKIAPLAHHLPSQLSGGQQQRVALARILVGQPNILMLDEPFSALDSHLRFLMEREVRQVIARFQKTVLLVSHDRDEVYRMADHLAVLRDGRVERRGTRDEVFRDPGTRSSCILTGCKNVSLIHPLDATHAHALEWGIVLKVPLKPDTDALGIRMHHIRPGPGDNGFACRVEEVIENPFSITVMLRPLDAPPGAAPIGWEMEKAQWSQIKSDRVTVHIPADAILQLKG